MKKLLLTYKRSICIINHYVQSTTQFKIALFIAFTLVFTGLTISSFAQEATVTVRFANPSYSTTTQQYCADVEFKSDTVGTEIFGMNVRFFYDETSLEFISFSDFQGGYTAVAPDPPNIYSSPNGPMLFNFNGSAAWVNGAMQLVDPNATPIVLQTVNWTKLFQVCFQITDPNPNVQSFCPSLVWDMEQDPENGGFLNGDDGVVITAVDPAPWMESMATIENVAQFNWVYIGSGSYPWGQPQQSTCIPLAQPITIALSCPASMNMEYDQSTSPSHTGYATASSDCPGNVAISYTDAIAIGACPNAYIISRTWEATNDCNVIETCVQTINGEDTQPPVLGGIPEDTKIICDPLPDPPVVYAFDGTGVTTVIYTETIQPGANEGDFDVLRNWTSTDDCGNEATGSQYIFWRPNAILSSDIILPTKAACNSDKVLITSLLTGNTQNVTYFWEVSGGKSYIQAGQGESEIYIYMGEEEVTITLMVTDLNGCTKTTTATLNCTVGRPVSVVPGSSAIKKRSSSVTNVTMDVWPNPINELMSLRFISNDTQKSEFRMVDLTGRVYLKESHDTELGLNTYNFDVSQIPEGTYIIQIKSATSVLAKTVVVMHMN
ncbi:MAG: T9SS type A sorting domain-containing protein [Saprospiraceae bacterium]